MKKCWFS